MSYPTISAPIVRAQTLEADQGTVTGHGGMGAYWCAAGLSAGRGAMRGQKFFFQSADRQHFAAQRNLAGHGDIATHGNLAQSAGNSGSDRDARRGAIFGDGAFRHMHVNVESAVEIALQSQAMGAR